MEPGDGGSAARDGDGWVAKRRRRPSRGELLLAAQLATRDERAIRTIEAELAPTLRGYLEHVLGDPVAAEDVLQQVLVQAWQRGGSYDPYRGSPLAWLMATARSRAIDELRRRVPQPVQPEVAAAIIDRRDPATDAAEQIAERWRVAHMLSQLPREEAELLRMRFELGLSQSAIAAQTGVPLGTVKMRMARALRRLREMLDEEEG